MQRHRLLATSLLASACTLTLAAQSPAAPLTGDNFRSPLTTIDPPNSPALHTVPPPSTPSTFTLTPPKPETLNSFKFSLPKKNMNALGLKADPSTPLSQSQPEQLAQIVLPKTHEGLLTRDAGPCYKLRVYGFAQPDLKSHHPHASTETDCTPASTSHVKSLQLQATPAPK